MVSAFLRSLSWILLCKDVASNISATVLCDTTKGSFKINVYRSWAPIGAEHFLKLVRDGFFSDIALFRCVDGFLTQFGISENPNMKHWHQETILDDPLLHHGIKRHYVSYAGSGKDSRSTEIFITFEDLDFLGFPDAPWEVPFGIVVDGENTLSNFYKGYGDVSPMGDGPDQNEIYEKGNAYIRDNFPLIDFINNCKIEYEESGDNNIVDFPRQETNRELSAIDAIDNKSNNEQESVDAGGQESLQQEESPDDLQTINTKLADTETVVSPEDSPIHLSAGSPTAPVNAIKSTRMAFTAVGLLVVALAVLYTLTRNEAPGGISNKSI